MDDNDLKCVCGHEQSKHTIEMSTGSLACNVLNNSDFDHLYEDECEAFKLDNLQFVEDLAKEKKLI